MIFDLTNGFVGLNQLIKSRFNCINKTIFGVFCLVFIYTINAFEFTEIFIYLYHNRNSDLKLSTTSFRIKSSCYCLSYRSNFVSVLHTLRWTTQWIKWFKISFLYTWNKTTTKKNFKYHAKIKLKKEVYSHNMHSIKSCLSHMGFSWEK